MPKTRTPLRIAVPRNWAKRPEIEALRAQGHVIETPGFEAYDLILGPTAHAMSEELLEYLGLAVLRAQRQKRSQDANLSEQ
jgi:hypothetical protein